MWFTVSVHAPHVAARPHATASRLLLAGALRGGVALGTIVSASGAAGALLALAGVAAAAGHRLRLRGSICGRGQGRDCEKRECRQGGESDVLHCNISILFNWGLGASVRRAGGSTDEPRLNVAGSAAGNRATLWERAHPGQQPKVAWAFARGEFLKSIGNDEEGTGADRWSDEQLVLGVRPKAHRQEARRGLPAEEQPACRCARSGVPQRESQGAARRREPPPDRCMNPPRRMTNPVRHPLRGPCSNTGNQICMSGGRGAAVLLRNTKI